MRQPHPRTIPDYVILVKIKKIHEDSRVGLYDKVTRLEQQIKEGAV